MIRTWWVGMSTLLLRILTSRWVWALGVTCQAGWMETRAADHSWVSKLAALPLLQLRQEEMRRLMRLSSQEVWFCTKISQIRSSRDIYWQILRKWTVIAWLRKFKRSIVNKSSVRVTSDWRITRNINAAGLTNSSWLKLSGSMFPKRTRIILICFWTSNKLGRWCFNWNTGTPQNRNHASPSWITSRLVQKRDSKEHYSNTAGRSTDNSYARKTPQTGIATYVRQAMTMHTMVSPQRHPLKRSLA